MAVDLCEHGDLAAACVDCLTGTPPERPNPLPPGATVYSYPIRARFDGHCAGCNLAIHVGQLIVGMDDGTHEHADCQTTGGGRGR